MRKPTAKRLVEETLDSRFLGGDNPPLKANVSFGPARTAKLVIVTGENASGKSFYRRMVQSVCQHRFDDKVECIHLSVEGRSSSGFMSGISRAFVYGDESRDSTGSNSISTIYGAFRTSDGRENDHVIVWDEPDLGLSEGASWGAGEEIARWLQSPPDHLVACVIISHSRYLLQEVGKVPHHFVCFEEGFNSIEEWNGRRIQPIDPQLIKDRNIETSKKIAKVIKDVKK